MKKYIIIALIFYLPLRLKLPNWPVFPVINIFMIVLLGMLLTSRNDRFKRPVFELPLVVFLLVWFASFVFACMFTDGMPRVEIAREFKRLYLLPLIYFVLSRCINDKKELNTYFIAFLLCLILCGQNTERNGVLAGANFALHKRSSGPFGWGWRASDIAGGFLGTFTPILLAYFFFTRQKLHKLISAIGVGWCGLGLMATYSRGSMMALLFASVATVIVGGRDLAKASKINFVVIFIGLIIGGVMWKAWVPQAIIARIEGTIEVRDEEREYLDASLTDDYGESVLDQSSQLRIKAWESGLQFFFDNPLTGIGFRQVQFQLGHDPHNAYVLIASEMGALGILVFIWFMLAVVVQGFRLMGTEYGYMGVGAVGMMVGFAIVNVFYSNFFRDNVVGTFWIMLAFLAAANSFVENGDGGEAGGEPANSKEKMTYAEYRKRYLQGLVLAVFTIATLAGPAHAKVDSRWWSAEDIPHLNAYKDVGPPSLKGRTFYVDQVNGDDAYDGQTLKTPFATVRRGLRHLKAGDMLLIKSGVYHESFWIRAQGEPEARVVIGPYGDGEVIIDAGLPVDTWQPHAGRVFKAKTPKPVRNIVLNEQPIHPVATLEEVGDGLWYFDKEASEVYLYLPKGTPGDHQIGLIEDNKNSHAIFLNGARYVTLYGLTIRYAGGKGVEILGPDNRIERCNIQFNGSHGIGMFTYKRLNSQNTQTVRNHIYHNMLANWPRGRWPFKNGGWGMGIGGPAGPGCEHTGNVVHKNGGEGIGSQSDGIVRDNIVANNWSVNIYADGAQNTVIHNNLIYCEEPDPRDIFQNFDREAHDNKSFRRLRAEGIMTADELKRTNAHNVRLTNNIIIGCRRGITHYGRSRTSGLKNVLVAHNTIVLPHAKGRGESFVGIRVPWNNGNNRGTVYRNNLVYGTHKNTYLASVSHDPLGRAEPFAGVTFDHNVWYHASNRKPFHIGIPKLFIQHYDFDGWKARGRAQGIGEGSRFETPRFIARSGYTAGSVALAAGSPAIDSGRFIEGLMRDYFGRERRPLPDIGAVEAAAEE